MLRLKTISPHGSASRRNDRSAGVNVVPASPVMNARAVIGAGSSVFRPSGSRSAAQMRQTNKVLVPQNRGFRRNSFFRQEALAASGLVTGAELARLLRRGERTHHGPIDHAFAAQIGAANNGLPAAELIGELGLQGAEGGLCITLALLRGELHDETARRARTLGRRPRCRAGGRRSPGWRIVGWRIVGRRIE